MLLIYLYKHAHRVFGPKKEGASNDENVLYNKEIFQNVSKTSFYVAMFQKYLIEKHIMQRAHFWELKFE